MKKYYLSILILITVIVFWNSASAQLADSPWPMFMHDAQHTARSEFKGPDYPVIFWQFEIGKDYANSPPVIGSDGTIYALSAPIFSETYLYAINPDGTLKWKTDMGMNHNSSTLTIGKDGVIYFGLTDQHFYAVNPEGNILWRFKTGDVNENSPSIDQDGTIYMGTSFGLFAINPDGTQKWFFQLYGYPISAPAIGHDGNIYISTNKDLISINPDGEPNWRYTSNEEINWGEFSSSPSIDNDGTIYIGAIKGYRSHYYLYL